MLLIHTGTLALHEFISGNVPPYAILSHRWADEEVTLQEYRSISEHGSSNEDDTKSKEIQSKSGYRKITSFCRLAREDGIDFGWVDTNCIDKSSSADLSEAINSMYQWYGGAVKCYAYLNDVTATAIASDHELFEQSQWFTRGWTLQELIAPKVVAFYANDWSLLGTREDLVQPIIRATGIDIDILMSKKVPSQYSIACRMSWASGRTTTREEDMAYSLLGIFDVNMPMLYGEGSKAFIRLQEEILKHSNDHSIFAWKDTSQTLSSSTAATVTGFSGLLARTPKFFADSADYRPVAGERPQSLLVALTSNGVSLNVNVVDSTNGTQAILSCCRGSQPQFRPCIKIACRSVPEAQFSRMATDWLEDTDVDTVRQNIYVRQAADYFTLSQVDLRKLVVKIVIRLEAATGSVLPSNMMVLDCWVSPLSYVVDSCREKSLGTTRARWAKATSVPTSSHQYGYWDRADELETMTFALPQFTDVPAILIRTNWDNFLIGRTYDGYLGVQEPPEGMADAIAQESRILDGVYNFSFEPLDDESEKLQFPKFRSKARIGVKALKRIPREMHDEITIVLKPERGEPHKDLAFEKKFTEAMRSWEFSKRTGFHR